MAHLNSRPDYRQLRRSRRYQKWRRGILQGEPLCRECHKEGRTVAAQELDHVIPVEQAPDRFWDRSNIQPLCRSHHEAKTARENSNELTKAQAEWDIELEKIKKEDGQ